MAEDVRRGAVEFHATLAAGLYKETFEGLIRKTPANSVSVGDREHFVYETWAADPETWRDLAASYAKRRAKEPEAAPEITKPPVRIVGCP